MKKNILLIILISTLLLGCDSNVDIKDSTPSSLQSEKTKIVNKSNNKSIIEFTFEKGTKVDISQLFIEDENYIIPNGYLSDTYWSGDEKLDKILMSETIKLMGRYTKFEYNLLNKLIFQDDDFKKYISEDEIVNLTTPNKNTLIYDKFDDNVVYTNHKIRPFYTKYDDYIGIERIIQFKEVKGLSADELYYEYSTVPERWNVNIDYYHIDADGKYTYDDEGYYKRLYDDKVKVEMLTGDLIDLNKYIDFSQSDFFSDNSTIAGMARWTDDVELNKALLAYLLNHDSSMRIFIKDYVTELINEEDALEIIKKFDNKGYTEDIPYGISEISIENYTDDNIFLINVVYISDPHTGPSDYRELFQSHYVVKQADGKYKVYYDKANLPK